jgi:hypothetical protein
MKTRVKLIYENLMLGQLFNNTYKSVAQLLLKLEESAEDWYPASIWGHSSHVHRLFMFYPTEIAELQARQINTVFQIFDTHLSRDIDKTLSITLL